MRKISVLLVISLLVPLFLSGAVNAAGTPPPPISSGFQLQNRSATSIANVQIAYYNAAGVLVETDSDTIAANASKSYYVPNVLGQPDGRYSVVVSSDQELFSLVNEVTAGAHRYVAATHSAFTGNEVGSPLYLPWVVASYYSFNSMFAVQNAGGAATTITVEFYQSGQSTPTRTYNFPNVAAGGAVYLDMLASPYATDLGTFNGGVKIYSTGNATPLAAVLNDTNPTGSFLRSYNAVKSGGMNLIAPQVTANYYSYSSGITLQNPGSVAAEVTISYYASGATTATTTQNLTIPGNSVRAVYLPNVPGMVTNFNGSAVIESNVELIGIANHDNPNGPAASYNLIPTTLASQTVYMPQIVRAYYGFQSGYMLFNTGTEPITVSVEFFTTAGASVTTLTHNIPGRSPFTMYLGDARGAALGSNFNGGAKVTVTSGTGAVVGIANFVAPNVGDNMQVYNVFVP